MPSRHKIFFKYKNTKTKLYKVNSAIWFNKTCKQKGLYHILFLITGLTPYADFVHFIDLLMMGNVLPETCRD